MKRERIYLYNKNEYVSPTLGEFIPFLEAYLHEGKALGSIIVVPGGAYSMVAAGEAEPVAEKLFAWNYNVYVLCYTCALFSGKPIKKQPFKDLARAIAVVKKRYSMYVEKEDNVCLCGFSAGGNLVSTVTGHADDAEIWPTGEYAGISLQVKAQILGYPVITAGEYTHKDTIANLWGGSPSEEELNYSSAQLNVSASTPPTFIWHTATDQDVNVQNTLLYAEALKAHEIPYAVHIFSNGPHGLSTADEKWASGDYGSFYTMDQFFKEMQYRIDHQVPMMPDQPLPPVGTNYEEMFTGMPKDYLKATAMPEVAAWIELAHVWLEERNREV